MYSGRFQKLPQLFKFKTLVSLKTSQLFGHENKTNIQSKRDEKVNRKEEKYFWSNYIKFLAFYLL